MSYWEDRQSRLLEDVVSTADNTSKEIAEVYFDASFYINSKLQDIFGRYKNKHGLTDKEALMLLNQMNDPTSYSELLMKLKGSKGEDRKELLQILEASAFRHRIRRLEELQKEIDHVMHSVYNQEKNISTLNYADIANESYYRTMYNLEKELNQSIGFTGVSEKHINSILNGKWSGKNYSERIWNNTTTLANELKRNLLLGIVAGKTEKEMIQEILGTFQVGNFRARRLVETESVYVSTMMDIEAFKEADVEVMRFVATHDLRTSKICKEHDSKLVRVSKAVPGVNVPPLHPHCRSFVIPVIDDELDKKLQRRNKKEDCSYEIVDANETYEEWYERAIKNKELIIEYDDSINKYYRDVNIDYNDKYVSVRKHRYITTYKVTSEFEMYVSEDIKLKRKQLHFIQNNIRKSLKLMNTKYIDKLPRIVIVTSNDMQTNAVAAYNAVKNELYINEKMGIKTELLKLQKDCAVPDNVLSTTLHELLYWEDAQKYIDKFGLIDTKDKYLKYYDYFNEISKEYIEKHYKKEYNFIEISNYAYKSIINNDFDEVRTEARVIKILRGE